MSAPTHEWQTRTGLTEEEFRRFTLYCNGSDNELDNCNRARMLGFHNDKVRVAPGAIVRIGANQPGVNSFIGLYCYINGDVRIGDNVLIGPHCSVTAGHHKFSAETGWFSDRTASDQSRIEIGAGSWLAAGCVVTAGVRIGICNLICANAVVTHDTDAYAVMAGTPARQLGRIDPDSGRTHWFKADA